MGDESNKAFTVRVDDPDDGTWPPNAAVGDELGGGMTLNMRVFI